MYRKVICLILFISLNNWFCFAKNTELKCYKSTEYGAKFSKNKKARVVVISGNVFNDPNGGNVNNSSGTTNLIPNNIYATLVNFSGTVMESVLVATNGSFSFNPVVEDEYMVLISINQGVTTEPSPLVVLPDGWQSTGEFNGAEDGGTDSQVDGTSELIQIDTDYSTINFGIKMATALPIDLIYFAGNIVENQINLTWKVENERDFSHFEIEQSIDAKAFHKIGEVKSNNKPSELANYQFFDPQTTNHKLIYYRLKMVDLNGNYKFSKIILVKYEQTNIFISAENPIQNGQFQVFTNLQNPVFSIINSTGKQAQLHFSEKDNSMFHLKILDYASGIYLLIIEAENKIYTRKLLIP